MPLFPDYENWVSVSYWVFGIASCALAGVLLCGIISAYSPTPNADWTASVRDTHRRRDPSQEPTSPVPRVSPPPVPRVSAPPDPRVSAPPAPLVAVSSPACYGRRHPIMYVPPAPRVSAPPAPLVAVSSPACYGHPIMYVPPAPRVSAPPAPPAPREIESVRLSCPSCYKQHARDNLSGECGACYGRRHPPAPPTGIHSGEPGASCIRKAEQLESIGDPTSKHWRKGAEGERATASLLRAELPGWSCQHDLQIPNSPANIDHIATAPDGRSVCLDSKFWTSWDIERLTKAAATLKWEAKEGEKLVGSTLEPVIVMHGYYDGPERVDGVRVLHSTAIGQL